MPYEATVYRVFVLSPFDVEGESDCVLEEIIYWNSSYGFDEKVMLEPLLEEVYAPPQANGHGYLEEVADILIGVFWTRLSGPSEEELRRFVESAKPTLFYFLSMPVAKKSVDTKTYSPFVKFKKWCTDMGVGESFETTKELRSKIQAGFTQAVQSLREDLSVVGEPADLLQEDGCEEAIEGLRDEFELFVDDLEAEWEEKRENDDEDIEEIKSIMSRARDEVKSFNKRIREDNFYIKESLEQALKHLEALENMRFDIGGITTDTFRERGDKTVSFLKEIATRINSANAKITLAS